MAETGEGESMADLVQRQLREQEEQERQMKELQQKEREIEKARLKDIREHGTNVEVNRVMRMNRRQSVVAATVDLQQKQKMDAELKIKTEQAESEKAMSPEEIAAEKKRKMQERRANRNARVVSLMDLPHTGKDSTHQRAQTGPPILERVPSVVAETEDDERVVKNEALEAEMRKKEQDRLLEEEKKRKDEEKMAEKKRAEEAAVAAQAKKEEQEKKEREEYVRKRGIDERSRRTRLAEEEEEQERQRKIIQEEEDRKRKCFSVAELLKAKGLSDVRTSRYSGLASAMKGLSQESVCRLLSYMLAENQSDVVLVQEAMKNGALFRQRWKTGQGEIDMKTVTEDGKTLRMLFSLCSQATLISSSAPSSALSPLDYRALPADTLEDIRRRGGDVMQHMLMQAMRQSREEDDDVSVCSASADLSPSSIKSMYEMSHPHGAAVSADEVDDAIKAAGGKVTLENVADVFKTLYLSAREREHSYWDQQAMWGVPTPHPTFSAAPSTGIRALMKRKTKRGTSLMPALVEGLVEEDEDEEDVD